ncbi:MAG: transcriptional regulator, partial [Proteobacteria bacterium]|nr:transcriptional regulator [Pseudomonadota bacterium]
AGLDEADGQRGPILDDPNSLVRAAIEGHGVFLGSPAMLSSEFDGGVLIQPFATSSELEPAYFLVYPEEAIQQQKIQAFRDFMLSEVNEQ